MFPTCTSFYLSLCLLSRPPSCFSLSSSALSLLSLFPFSFTSFHDFNSSHIFPSLFLSAFCFRIAMHFLLHILHTFPQLSLSSLSFIFSYFSFITFKFPPFPLISFLSYSLHYFLSFFLFHIACSPFI